MNSFVVAGRVVRQIVKDRRTLALLIVAPLMAIFLLHEILNIDAFRPQVLTLSLPAQMQSAIAEEADVTPVDDLDAALEELKYSRTDGVIVYDEPTVTVYVEGSQSMVTASVKKALATAVADYSKQHAQESLEEKVLTLKESILEQVRQQLMQVLKANGANTVAVPEVDIAVEAPSLSLTSVEYSYLNGSDDMTTFDSIAPLMMGFFIFFFVFLLAGVAFLRERISGTLERLLSTPIRRHEIVFGYFLGFGLFVLVQTLLIQLYMVHVLHIALKGNFLLVLLINLLLAAGSLALGTLLSAFARNELQLFQFIPLVIVPQILFCGLFNLRGAPAWIAVLSKIFPLTYAADALTNVAFRGFGFGVILPDLLILFGYMVLFLALNTVALKRYRKI